jgi:predicted regulator of amino acid metabolism with ACT domain
MWNKIDTVFNDFPVQKRVAYYLLEKGLQVKENGKIAVDGCNIPSMSLSRRLGIDRRVIDSAAKAILNDEELKKVFSNLTPIAFLRNSAKDLGLGVISISVKDAKKPGIIKRLTDCISKHKVSIRQAIADDPYLVDEPKFTVVTAEKVHGALLEDLKNIDGVNEITIL